MTQRIRRFGVAQTAKFFGVMYALIGLIALPIFVLVAMVAPRQAGFGLGLAILLPILLRAPWLRLQRHRMPGLQRGRQLGWWHRD